MSPEPLSSDSFTAFETGPDKVQNEENVASMHRYLLKTIIPSFAAELAYGRVNLKNPQNLVSQVHERGINVSFLGVLRSNLPKVPVFFFVIILFYH